MRGIKSLYVQVPGSLPPCISKHNCGFTLVRCWKTAFPSRWQTALWFAGQYLSGGCLPRAAAAGEDPSPRSPSQPASSRLGAGTPPDGGGSGIRVSPPRKIRLVVGARAQALAGGEAGRLLLAPGINRGCRVRSGLDLRLVPGSGARSRGGGSTGAAGQRQRLSGSGDSAPGTGAASAAAPGQLRRLLF